VQPNIKIRKPFNKQNKTEYRIIPEGWGCRWVGENVDVSEGEE
jgi:hypothetical protein